MPETDIGSTTASNLSNVMVEYSVMPETTDAGGGDVEFRYQLSNWAQYFGYYKTIPELQVAVDAEATWTVGGGFEADPRTELHLSLFTGSGKDSFNDILFNMTRTCTLAGDAYAEIITDKNDVIINLKPLDPSSMVIVYGRNGRIKRYEQVEKSVVLRKFKPERIFHLSRKRIADEVHGISIIPSIEWVILARNQAMQDWKTVLHRNVSPLQIHYLDTDEPAEVSAYKTKADAARRDGENLYVPKNTVQVEVVQSQLNQASSPLAWIDQLKDFFFQAVGVPQIIIGNAKEFTDASAKIVYLAYEQAVKGKQLYIEEQVLNQLNLEIKLTFPASLQQDLITSVEKGGPAQAATPNDTTVEMEGQT